jgi:hypothetical protein
MVPDERLLGISLNRVGHSECDGFKESEEGVDGELPPPNVSNTKNGDVVVLVQERKIVLPWERAWMLLRCRTWHWKVT